MKIPIVIYTKFDDNGNGLIKVASDVESLKSHINDTIDESNVKHSFLEIKMVNNKACLVNTVFELLNVPEQKCDLAHNGETKYITASA